MRCAYHSNSKSMKFAMKFLILVILLFLASCASTSKAPPDTVFVGESGVGRGSNEFISKHFIDKKSFEYSKNDLGEKIVRYWEIEFLSTLDKETWLRKDQKFKNLKEERSLQEINCDRQALNGSSVVRRLVDEEGNIISETTSERFGVIYEDGSFSTWVPITRQYPVRWASFSYLCK